MFLKDATRLISELELVSLFKRTSTSPLRHMLMTTFTILDIVHRKSK